MHMELQQLLDQMENHQHSGQHQGVNHQITIQNSHAKKIKLSSFTETSKILDFSGTMIMPMELQGLMSMQD